MTLAALCACAAFYVGAQRYRLFSVLLFVACAALPFAVAADLGAFR